MPPSVGMQFGRYELLAKLGEGAMGEVFRARDRDLGRDVAIKFLPERYASDAGRLGRFAQEARAASSLNHPNIVTIHEIGQVSGVPYIVMELVDGETLRELLARRPPDVRRVLEIGAQIADGLSKAHEAGIVHRDLKPENVMVTRDRFVKILDFGLAKLRGAEEPEVPPSGSDLPTAAPHDQSPKTVAGTVLGTVGYMSPEQTCGAPLDGRSDQFALGVILYEMVTGQRPFTGSSPIQTMIAIVDHAPQPIPALNPSVPEPVCWIVERCLSKDASDRYAATADLARELRAVRERLSTGSGPARPHPPQAEPRTEPRTAGRPRVAMAGLGLAALALVGAGLSPAVRERTALALHLRSVPSDKRLAVLPFEAASGSAEDRALADGLSDLLTVRLTQLERFQSALSVEPTSNVRRSGVTSAEKAAGSLGVNLVVSGSVRRLGDRLLLTTSLEDARRRKTLRSESAESPDELLERTVRMLELELGPEAKAELRAAGTGVAEASTLTAEALGYTPWAEGRSALERYDQAKSLERAIELFNRALERDPRYALAHSALAEAYFRLYVATRKPEYVPLARGHAERALALDPLLSSAYVTLGMVEAGTGRAAEAAEAFQRALDRDPRSAAARREYGVALEDLGRFSEAEAMYRQAVALRPADWANRSYLGFFLLARGRCAEAEVVYQAALKLAPDNARLWSSLGGVRSCLGRPADAIAAFQRSIALHPTPQAISNLATLQFQARRYAEAAATLEKAVNGGTRDFRVWRNYAAALFWAPGQRDRARPAYRKAAELAERERAIRPNDARTALELADCYAMLGDAPRARALVTEAAAEGVPGPALARVAAGVHEELGDRAGALRFIGEALRAGAAPSEIESDPTFESLRADARYAALLPKEGSERRSP